MRVLVGCEESQAVTIELRRLGHEAYSCDTQDCSGGHPEWHIKDDVLKHLSDGWDLGIFFPDCTYLTVTANKWLKDQPKRKSGALVGAARGLAQAKAIAFFTELATCEIPKIAIENPVGIMSTHFRKSDQIIQPYNFGSDASKRTCLWLVDLPKLQNTKYVAPRTTKEGKKRWSNQTEKDGSDATPPSKDRAKLRSKTFPGIARAMAEQWAGKNESTMKDINGIEIKVGQTVKTQQSAGGMLPPGKPKTGVVEKAIESFGNEYLRIRYREKAQSFDTFIDLEGKINEVVSSNKSKQLLFGQDSGADRDENDFYATPAHATELFLNNFLQDHELDQVWEPACGSGDMSDVLEDYLILDRSSDLIDRGYGATKDFLKCTEAYDGDIMTNPPFKVAPGFVEKGLELLQKDRYLILLLRIQFAESKKRKNLYSSLCRIYVHSERIYCAKDGDFEKIKNGGSSMMYAWFVWKKGYVGETVIKWL